MSLKPIFYIALTAVIAMFGVKFILGSEQLVTEDGQVSATVLPFDKKMSEVRYETATFGMG